MFDVQNAENCQKDISIFLSIMIMFEKPQKCNKPK